MLSHYRAFALTTLLLLSPLGLVFSGCGTQTTNLVTGETTRGAYTWQQEVQLGRDANQQIIAQFGLYDNQQLQTYVQQLGEEVLATSAYGEASTPAEIRNTPFYFQVLDSDVVNAFALPGGYIYVTRGLLSHLENEAQLAMVLGHEAGHVLARHSSRQALQAQQGQLGLLGATIAADYLGSGRLAQQVANLGGTGLQLLFLSYSRDDEREADQAGVAYAEFAGYDAAQAAGFFRSLERLGAQSGGSLPSFLSTHPDPGERQQTIPQLAAQYDPQGTEVGQQQLLNQIEGIVLGTNPRQGFTEGNTFYHPDLRFQFSYPSGWQVANGAAAVQIGEPNGRAVMEFTFAQEDSPQAAARAFSGQQGFQLANQEATTVNGNSAYAISGTATTQQGEIGLIAYFIEYGGTVYRFMGLTSANALSQYDDEFVGAMRSFQRLTNATYLNREPVRLEVVSAPRTASFQSFLSGRPTPQGMDANGLAIMNGVELNQQIAAGTPLKLPQD